MASVQPGVVSRNAKPWWRCHKCSKGAHGEKSWLSHQLTDAHRSRVAGEESYAPQWTAHKWAHPNPENGRQPFVRKLTTTGKPDTADGRQTKEHHQECAASRRPFLIANHTRRAASRKRSRSRSQHQHHRHHHRSPTRHRSHHRRSRSRSPPHHHRRHHHSSPHRRSPHQHRHRHSPSPHRRSPHQHRHHHSPHCYCRPRSISRSCSCCRRR